MAERARLCKWYITAADRALVAASAKLPVGVSQLLRTCTQGSACSHEHSDLVSSINKDRLIAKRARLLRVKTGPTRKQVASDKTYTGCLKYDKTRGMGYIYPDAKSRSKLGRARKQRVFFHSSAWTGTTHGVLLRDILNHLPKQGLPVQYRREANTSMNQRAGTARWKAVGVAMLGPIPKTTSARVLSIAREVHAGTKVGAAATAAAAAAGATAGAAAGPGEGAGTRVRAEARARTRAGVGAGAGAGTGPGPNTGPAGAAGQHTAANLTKVPPSSLPKGWEQQTDPAGRLYYIDHHNKQTTWKRPGAPELTTSSSGDKCRLQEIPRATGWEQKTDTKGKTYYIDHDRKLTTWQRPTALEPPSGRHEKSPPEDRGTGDAGGGRQKATSTSDRGAITR